MSAIVFKGADFSAPINFVGMYSDGTPMVKTDQFQEIVEKADTIVVRPDSLNSFVTAMFLVDAVTSKGGWIKNLILPYVPGARQDRVNPTGDVLFTAKSVVDMINSRYFHRVTILDPHSQVTPGMINNVENYPLSRIARRRVFDWHDGVIAPDKGAKDRAETFANALDLDVIYASKTRDVATGRLSGFEVTVEKGKHYLVVDDICDGGGTFLGLGEKIIEQGATADLYVTHGIFSKGARELKKIYKNIITTDSRRLDDNKNIFVIPVVEDMENYND